MSAVSPYPDLEPWMWRSLLARAVVFHATRTRLSQFCDHVDRGGAVERVLRDLELHRAAPAHVGEPRPQNRAVGPRVAGEDTVGERSATEASDASRAGERLVGGGGSDDGRGGEPDG